MNRLFFYFRKEKIVLGASLDFDLLAKLTESGTVTGTVLTGDPDLLSVLGHLEEKCKP